MVDPMASQMAALLADSDLEELEEIVKRWVMEAPDAAMKHHYAQFGSKLLQLKRELQSKGVQPRKEDLEIALSMMLKLAAERK
jgi:hypothetical protein